jgi:hypothetical protein
MAQMGKGEGQQQLNLLIKADVQGSVEALRDSLVALSNDLIKINVIQSGVGGITESEAVMAAAAKAVVIGFNVRADAAARESAVPDGRCVAIRLQWGGGTPRAWSGSIAVVHDGAPLAARSWRTLCPEPDAAAMAHDAAGVIELHQPRPVASDGVELVLPRWQTARVAVRLAAADATQPPVILDVPVAEVLAAPVQRPLDDAGNRLTIKAAPGDALRVTAAPDTAGPYSAGLLGEVRRAPVPELGQVEAGVQHRGRIDRPFLPLVANGGAQIVSAAPREVVARVARNES